MGTGTYVCPTCLRQYDDLRRLWSRPNVFGNNTCAKCTNPNKKCKAAQGDSRVTINAVS